MAEKPSPSACEGQPYQKPTTTIGSAPVRASTAATGPLPNRTEPPAPGSTRPFGQRELDAIRNESGVWVWSGTLEEWLFVVRNEGRKAKAVSRSLEPGCIWTLAEITGIAGMPAEGLKDVAKIKRQFNGTIQSGAMPAQWRNALEPLAPVVAEEDNQ